jgi:adenine phosphoribosyltransferase
LKLLGFFEMRGWFRWPVHGVRPHSHPRARTYSLWSVSIQAWRQRWTPACGFLFKDVTPLFANPNLFGRAIADIVEAFRDQRITKVVGIEARGFPLGAPIALSMGVGFIPARKPGKLPQKTISERYTFDYGNDELHLHLDSIKKGDRVLIVDDVLATGGTATAVEKLVNRLGGEVVGFGFLLELGFLPGKQRLGADRVHAIVVTPTSS